MVLLQHLKQARARPRRLFTRTAFTVVSALMREHKLDESFLDSLRKIEAQANEWVWSYQPRPKNPFQPPLFALVTADEFRLIQTILAALDNPYVLFAHCPEELLVSGRLFRLNPDLPPAILERVHFRTLLAQKLVQTELQDHQRTLENSADSRDPQAALKSLLNRLNEFIDHATHPST
jgi:hypothetical protein